jgi:CheY-like chemotaxis protein
VKPIERGWLIAWLSRLVRRGPGRKVLVVDDDDVARYVVRRALEDSPFELLEAAGGQQGLEKARRERPDVILLDLSMPDLSGFDVLDALEADEASRDIPVIIHSGRILDDAERARLSASASGIIGKNELDREGALRRIRAALLHAGVVPEEKG